MTEFIIRKLNAEGREVFRYPAAQVLARWPAGVTVEAFFARQDRLELGYTVFERGDRFIEHFYADRWYNVFEIRAVGTGALRGWYCNIARPAVVAAGEVAQIDLALDAWVRPDGSVLVLDEDEFAALALAPADAAAARAALDEIIRLAAAGAAPFSRQA